MERIKGGHFWTIKSFWHWTNKEANITIASVERIVSGLLNGSGKKITIGTTWSSWRVEDYSELDELELLIYWREDGFIEDIKILEQALLSYSWNNCRIVFERKLRSKPEYFEWVEWREIDVPRFFPSRFIDFLPIHGCACDYNSLLKEFLNNIENANSRDLRDWKSRVRSHKRISNTWIWRWKWEEYKIFDPNEKIINYSKTDGGIEISLKVWALRYIQYQIIQLVITLIRGKRINVTTFKEMWRSVSSKIDFLQNFDIELGLIELEELKGLYSFFLWIHNNLSAKFNKDWEGILELSDNEFKLFYQNLKDFNRLMTRFRIKS